MERGVWWLMAYGPWGSQSIGHNWVTNTVKLQNNCKETGNFLGSKNLYLDVNECARMWSSVQFSHSVMSDSATPWTHHASLSIINSRSLLKFMFIESVMPSNHLIPFSSLLRSFPASGSFQMSQFFTSGGQSFGVSASPSILPMNIQDWFPLGWTGWISLQSKGLSRVFSNTAFQKQQFFGAQLSL